MEDRLTLLELNSLIKGTIEVSFPEEIWVIAEISELKVNRAGHCYIELVEKDKENDRIVARARATIWSWQYRFIKPYFETNTGQILTAGLKVLVAVSVEFHEQYGLSLNIKDIDPNYTLGDMARKRQEVINRLTEEGIIDMNKELPLPDIPSRIAIISSPTAAGYEDFMKQLHNNPAGYKFYTRLFQATMQGNGAVSSIIAALDYIYEFEDLFDVVVIIRGGGSQLDLSCFDQYELAYPVTQFPLPVLTGIGHEKDESVTDMVAHTRLKTPTAVAEFLIGQMDNVANEIDELGNAFMGKVSSLLSQEEQRLNQAFKLFKPLISSRIEHTSLLLKQLAANVKPLISDVLDNQHFKLDHIADHLKMDTFLMLKEQNNRVRNMVMTTSYLSRGIIRGKEFYFEETVQKLKRFTNRKLEKESNKLEWLEKNRQLTDPQNILKRGFSITLKNGKAVKSAGEIEDGDLLETILSQGKIISKTEKF